MGSIRSIDTIIVGVQNINKAIELWVNQFGLDIVSERNGIDTDLSRLWQLDDNEVVKQALLATPKIDVGKIHLVQFKNPSTPVRKNANATGIGDEFLEEKSINKKKYLLLFPQVESSTQELFTEWDKLSMHDQEMIGKNEENSFLPLFLSAPNNIFFSTV